jgi:hypothetical protein
MRRRSTRRSTAKSPSGREDNQSRQRDRAEQAESDTHSRHGCRPGEDPRLEEQPAAPQERRLPEAPLPVRQANPHGEVQDMSGAPLHRAVDEAPGGASPTLAA